MNALFLLFALAMPLTVFHNKTATSPDQAGVEVNSSQWNDSHAFTLSATGSELIGAFSNANGMSFGTSGGAITASYTVPATGAFLTTAMASNRGTDFVQATAAFAGTNASGTIASNAISVSVGNYITTAMASNRGTDFVQATAAFAGTSASGTINSTGISVSIGPYITTGALSGDTSKYVQNWKLTGNTAGTTSSAQGTDLWLAGGQGITVSGSSNTVSFSVGSYITTAMASNRATDFVAATAAFAGTNASGTIASGGISVSVAAPGGTAPATLSYWEHPGGAFVGTQTMTAGGSSALVFPFVLENYVSASYIRIPASWTLFSTSFNTAAVPWSSSMSAVNTMYAVIYSQGTGGNSRSLQYVTSASAGWTNQISLTGSGATNNWTVSLRVTFPSEGLNTNNTSSSYASTLSTVNVSVTGLSDLAGLRYLDIPFAASMSPGNYWIALQRNSSSSGAAFVGYVASLVGVSQANTAIGNLGTPTNNSLQFQAGLGSWSTNSNGTTTSSMGLASISSMVSQVRLSFGLMRQA